MAGVDVPIPFATLVSHLRSGIIAAHLDIVSAMILLYDYCITFNEEVEYIWKRPWTYVTTLFMITRYLPFIDVLFVTVVTRHSLPVASAHTCRTRTLLTGGIFIFGLPVADAVFIVRTVAIWGGSRRIATLLILTVALHTPPILYVSIRFLNSMTFIQNPFPPAILPGCFVTGAEHIIFVCYTLLLSYETVIFIVTFIKVYQDRNTNIRYESRHSPLYRAIQRDGLVFYAYLVATSAVNIAFQISGSGFEVLYLMTLHRVLHAILAERLLLNIRGAPLVTTSGRDITTTETAFHDLSTIRFAARTQPKKDDTQGERPGTEVESYMMNCISTTTNTIVESSMNVLE